MYAMGPRAKLGFRVTSALVNITSRLPRDICLSEYHLHSYSYFIKQAVLKSVVAFKFNLVII
jgi:hypothetical protein